MSREKKLEDAIIDLVKARPQTYDVAGLYGYLYQDHSFSEVQRTVKRLVNKGQGVLDWLGSADDMRLIAVNVPNVTSAPSEQEVR